MFTFTIEQKNQIQELLDDGDFPTAYNLAADFAEGQPGVDPASIIWMRGAAQINAAQGPFSVFIRGYTKAQYEARYGATSSGQVDALIQDASNTIAGNVLGHILSTGHVPTLADIALQDAQPAAQLLFGGDAGGWAGNPLFLGLGYDVPLTSNITEWAESTYDALAMVKFTLSSGTAYSNFQAVLNLIFSGGLGGSLDAVGAAASGFNQVNTFLTEAYGGLLPTIELAANAMFDAIILGRLNAGDTLTGSSIRNFIHGGSGDDTIIASGGSDVLDGGLNDDTVSYADADAINVTIKSAASPLTYVGFVSSNGLDALFNIEKIVGSGSNDSFVIQSFSATLQTLELDGGGGTDTLSTFYVPGDTIFNTISNSLSVGGKSLTIHNFEKLEGGSGNDRFIVNGTVESLDGRDGRDYADFSLSQSAVVVGKPDGVQIKNIEVVYGSEQGDEIVASNALVMFGRGGGDKLVGGNGGDVLDGGAEADDLTGGGGGDIFVVGQGDLIWDATASDRMGLTIKDWITGVAKRPEGSDDPYEGMGYLFVETNGVLHVSKGGNVVAIVMDFSNGDLGITLEEEKEEEDPPWNDPIDPPPSDPMVLDLNGDGLNFVSVGDSGAHFDLNEDGFRERVGWLAPTDGFLIGDANANGLVDGHGEMFGDDSQHSYQALSALDSNGDGQISAEDTAFETLKVWRDLNQDGESQVDELTSLADEGIVSIGLASTVDGGEVEGIGIIRTGTYVRFDGAEGATASVLLSRQPVLSIWTPPAEFELAPEAAILPELRGYGVVKNLSAAMTLDTSLLAAVTALVEGLSELDHASARSTFEGLLAQWADIGDVTAGSRGAYVDAEHLAVVEAFTGTVYSETVGGVVTHDPQAAGAFGVEGTYDNLVDSMFLRLLAQATNANGALNGELYDFSGTPFAVLRAFVYDPETDDLSWTVEGILEALSADAPVQSVELQAHFIDGLRLIRAIHLGDQDTAAADLAIALLPGLPTLSAAGRATVMREGLGVSVAEGGAGDDSLSNILDAAVYVGHGGDDLLQGGRLEDIYVYRLGDGDDTIVEGGLARPVAQVDDTLRLGPGITPEMVELGLRIDGDHRSIILTFIGHDGSVVLYDQLSEVGFNGIEVIRFDDGAIWERSYFEAIVLQQGATDGDDILEGGAGDDTLDGGLGDDLLKGDHGSDHYIYEVGDGEDMIDDRASMGIDVLRLGAGLASEDLVLENTGDGLRLSFAHVDGGILLVGQGYYNQGIEQITFDNGETWSSEDLMQAYFDRAATAGDDVVQGFDRGDVLFGREGNDRLIGGRGSDTYHYELGDGDDVVEDFGSYYGDKNVLLLGEGIDPSDVVLSRNEQGHLRLSFAQGGSITLPNQFEGSNADIDEIRFDNGAVWTRSQIETLYLTSAATSGDDYIILLDSDDTIAGGLGDDTIVGGYPNGGADTFLYDLGDGHDIIVDSPEAVGPNRLVLGAMIDPEAISYTRSGEDMILTFADGGTITLRDQFGEYYGVQEIIYRDGAIVVEADFVTLLSGPTDDDDELYGDIGDNTLAGGLGDDLLIGDRGSDTYDYAPGDGHDVIREADRYEDTDGLSFGAGISLADLHVTRDGDDAVIAFTGQEGSIRLEGQFEVGKRYLRAGVEQVRLADGAVLDRQQLQQRYLDHAATAGDNEILGFATGDQTGPVAEGDDVLHGGGGNDVLVGLSGSDTYRFNAGDGQDVVVDDNYGVDISEDEGVDALELGGSLSAGGVVVHREDDDAILDFGNGDTVRLVEQFAVDRSSGEYVGNGVETVRFADGSEWSRASILQAYLAGAGTPGDDDIVGSVADDVITGAGGDDRLAGGSGGDSYVWNRGDGADLIIEATRPFGEPTGIDKIAFGPDILPADVTVERSGNDAIVHVAGDTGSIMIRNHFHRSTSEAAGYGVEAFVFAGGAIWSRAQIDQGLLDDSYGTQNDDILTGTAGTDHVWGDDGADTISGGDGDDILAGEAGDDVIDGGAGEDAAVYESQMWLNVTRDENGVVHVHDGATGGTDTLIDVEYLLFDDVGLVALASILPPEGTSGADVFAGTEGDDTFEGRGGNDSISGAGGNDQLAGGDGEDALFGQAGDDDLAGNDGADALDGGDGEDWLNGGAGNDLLTGGAGADRFIFEPSSAAETDEVADYDATQDTLDFSSLLFSGRGTVISAAVQEGDDVRITSGDATVLLRSTTLDDLRQAAISIDGRAMLTPLIKARGTANLSTTAAVSVDGTLAFETDPSILASEDLPHVTIEATAAGGGDEYYAFTVLAGARVVLDIDGASFDTIIDLLDVSGSVVVTNDDGGADAGDGLASDSMIDQIIVQGGQYFVRVRDAAQPGLTSGENYRLHVSIEQIDLVPDIEKPGSTANVDAASAVSLEGAFDLLADADITDSTTLPHATVHAVANGSGDEYYAFTAEAGARGVFDIDGASFDTFISILDADGQIIAENDDSDGDPGSESGLDSFVDHVFEEGGTYYLVVRQYGASSIDAGGAYTLQASLVGGLGEPASSVEPYSETWNVDLLAWQGMALNTGSSAADLWL